MTLDEMPVGAEVFVHDVFDGTPHAMPCVKLGDRRKSEPNLIRLLGNGAVPNGLPVEYGLAPDMEVSEGHVYPLESRSEPL
jgi:hypothetical protein